MLGARTRILVFASKSHAKIPVRFVTWIVSGCVCSGPRTSTILGPAADVCPQRTSLCPPGDPQGLCENNQPCAYGLIAGRMQIFVMSSMQRCCFGAQILGKQIQPDQSVHRKRLRFVVLCFTTCTPQPLQFLLIVLWFD